MAPRAPELTPRGVALSAVVGQLGLEVVAAAGVDLDQRLVTSAEVNRPGRQWEGYSEDFPSARLQLIGESEVRYLEGLPGDVRWARLAQYAQLGMPAVVLAGGLALSPEAVAVAEANAIPVLRSSLSTAQLASGLSWYLAVELAPRTVLHAGLVDVAGEGVLIMGRAGIGKSEAALELVRRGHRLIADDTVEVRRPTEHELIGRAPGRMRYFMEIKGIGIVNLRAMYGVGSVKAAADLSMVVMLEHADPGRPGRSGPATTDLLGVSLPLVTIPVRPGRNVAILVETAAMDIRARRLLHPRTDPQDRPDVRVELFESLD